MCACAKVGEIACGSTELGGNAWVWACMGVGGMGVGGQVVNGELFFVVSSNIYAYTFSNFFRRDAAQ
jgi:hypothetical protein